MKRITALLVISLFGCLLCDEPSKAQKESLRIISLAPSTTEILFALRAQDEIIETIYKTVVVVKKNPISSKPYVILLSK